MVQSPQLLVGLYRARRAIRAGVKFITYPNPVEMPLFGAATGILLTVLILYCKAKEDH